MRAPVLALLVASLLMPSIPAQEAPFLSDAAGDVALLVAEEQEIPGIAADPADLLSLDIEELPELLRFTVQVAGLGQSVGGQSVDAARLDVRFLHGDMRFDVGTGIVRDGSAFAELRRGAVGQPEQLITDLPYQEDGAGRFIVDVPRDLLRDHNGVPPIRGQTLTGLHMDAHVHATGIFFSNPDGTLFQPLGIRDRMPDDGDVEYAVQTGGAVWSGPVRLEVPVPFRASNGGAGTFAYELLLHNEGDSTRTMTPRLVDVPQAWTVEHPKAVIVPPGNTTTHVVVTTPFGHQHGGTESLRIEYVDPEEPGVMAATELGIHYLDIPQPAGHHDTLYLHSVPSASPLANLGNFLGPARDQIWFNTETEDPDDAAAPVEGTAEDLPASTFSWYACLRPQLRMGLDFTNDTGNMVLQMTSDTGFSGTLTGRILHLGPGEEMLGCRPDQWGTRNVTALATMETTASDGGLDVAVVPTEASDRVPYQHGAALALELILTTDAPRPDAPRLGPGGSMTLPLAEYADTRPAGLVGEVVQVVVPVNVTAAAADEDARKSPAPFLALVVGLVLVGWVRRRL